MKSALKIVAFANNDPATGIIALLEVALDALDAANHPVAAAMVASALHTYSRSLPDAPHDEAATGASLH